MTDSVLNHLVRPKKAFLAFAQNGGDSLPRLDRKIQPVARGPMVESASAQTSRYAKLQCPSPNIRPQGQRRARVGSISPIIVERDVDLRRLVSLPSEGMGTNRALRERGVCLKSALDLLTAAYWASFWKAATSLITLAVSRVPCVTSWIW